MEFDFDDKLYISQIIPTIQGEGNFVGVPSILIRLAGCNLRCKFCDTKYTWDFKKIGLDQSIVNEDNFSELLVKLEQLQKAYPSVNLMITGGEPLLYKNNELLYRLVHTDMFNNIEIETNGCYINNIPTGLSHNRVHFNISPKLDPSFYINKTEFHNLTTLIKESIYSAVSAPHNITLKFVYRDDLINLYEDFIKEVEAEHWMEKRNIKFMSETPPRKDFNNEEEFISKIINVEREALKYCLNTGYTFISRLHLYMFQNEQENI